jgi:GNAT superfamily N-acetyltransferase
MTEFDPNFLFREGNFVYKILTPQQRDPALIVLARAFCTEPVVTALGKADPKMDAKLHDWVEFVEHWMDHCSTNGLSVYALDETNHRIAGVFIVRDLFWCPDGFEKSFRHDHSKVLTPWMHFLWDLDAMAGKNFEPLRNAKQGEAVDLWFLGVHPDYRGNRIANSLIRGILPLIKKAGFKYGTIEATSAFTSKAAQFNGFQAVVSIEAKDWLWQGKPLYVHAPPPPHGTWTFWVKDLNEC